MPYAYSHYNVNASYSERGREKNRSQISCKFMTYAFLWPLICLNNKNCTNFKNKVTNSAGDVSHVLMFFFVNVFQCVILNWEICVVGWWCDKKAHAFVQKIQMNRLSKVSSDASENPEQILSAWKWSMQNFTHKRKTHPYFCVEKTYKKRHHKSRLMNAETNFCSLHYDDLALILCPILIVQSNFFKSNLLFCFAVFTHSVFIDIIPK